MIAVSDSSGDLVGTRNRYDEYGNVQGSLTGRFGYTGQPFVPEFGLYYYRARIYNPALGRFMQADPIGYDAGMNRYAYVRNDPMNMIDPSGMTNWYIGTGSRLPNRQDIGPGLCGSCSGFSSYGMGPNMAAERRRNDSIPWIATGTLTTSSDGSSSFAGSVTFGGRLRGTTLAVGNAEFFSLLAVSDFDAGQGYVSDADLPSYAHILRGRRVTDPVTGDVSLVNIPSNYRLINAPRGSGYLLVPPTWTPGSTINIIRMQPAGTGSVSYNPNGYFVVYGQSGAALDIRTGQALRATDPRVHNPWGGVIPPTRLSPW